MAFPKMPPVNVIRQLLMFEKRVPHRMRFWSIILIAICYQISNGVYLGAVSQMVGETTFLSEDFTMANYVSLIGLNIIFPILFRLKFGLYTRQLFFVSSIIIIICNICAFYNTSPVFLWVICLVAGYFKMLGMFGCMSTVQLNFTPTRKFAVFLPIIYLIVSGSVQITIWITSYVTYYFSWRLMHMVTIILMIGVDSIVYFGMKHDHRSGPYIPLKGIDWIGQTLWILLCCTGTWIFTFGEHYDWWDGIETWRATWLFIVLLAATLIYSRYKKEPFIALKAFTYPQVWKVLILLMGMAIISGAVHVLQPIFINGVLNYDILNTASLCFPQLAGDIMGCILSYFILVRWRWSIKKFLYLNFFFATYYLVSMYFLCYDQTAKEMLYFGIFAFGVAEVMMDTIATYYLSQSIPFIHFFMTITIMGFVRCGFGSSIGTALASRIFAITAAKDYMIASESITPSTISDVTMNIYAHQGLLMAIKDAYGAAIFVGIAMILIVLISNYRTTITRFLPRIMAVRRWMTSSTPTDPTLS
jgi:hypothetical protein